jgi:hypothetical protein
MSIKLLYKRLACLPGLILRLLVMSALLYVSCCGGFMEDSKTADETEEPIFNKALDNMM